MGGSSGTFLDQVNPFHQTGGGVGTALSQAGLGQVTNVAGVIGATLLTAGALGAGAAVTTGGSVAADATAGYATTAAVAADASAPVAADAASGALLSDLAAPTYLSATTDAVTTGSAGAQAVSSSGGFLSGLGTTAENVGTGLGTNYLTSLLHPQGSGSASPSHVQGPGPKTPSITFQSPGGNTGSVPGAPIPPMAMSLPLIGATVLGFYLLLKKAR